jgi:hypothetical protein
VRGKVSLIRLLPGRNGIPLSQPPRISKPRPDIPSPESFPQLTEAIKNQILGLNAARLFSVNVKARRQADRLTRLREEYRQNLQPSNTQYGWVWVEDGRRPTIPVGEDA